MSMADTANPEEVKVSIPRPKSQAGPSGELKKPMVSQGGAMNWIEMMKNFIAKGRVRQAAIFDTKGKCLSSSKKDLIIPQGDVFSLLRVLENEFVVRNQPNFGLYFGEDRYICFRADRSTVIGLNPSTFFVAHRCEDILIIGFCDMQSSAEVSCISEVWTFAREVRSRMEISSLIG